MYLVGVVQKLVKCSEFDMLDFIFRHFSPFTENTPCSPSSPQLDAFNIFPQQNVSHLNKTDIMDITRSLGPFVWNSKFWLFWIFSHRSCFIGIWCWQRPLAWSAPPQKVAWTPPPPPCPKGTWWTMSWSIQLLYNRIDRVNLLRRGLNKKGAKYICQGLTLLLVHLSPHTNLKVDTKEGNYPSFTSTRSSLHPMRMSDGEVGPAPSRASPTQRRTVWNVALKYIKEKYFQYFVEEISFTRNIFTNLLTRL